MAAPTDSPRLFKRILASIFALVQMRLELISIEFAEEKARVLKILCIGWMVMLFSAMALSTFTALIVLVFWDIYRWQALAVLTLIYLILAIVGVLKLRASVHTAPLLFASTSSEFKKDSDAFKETIYKSS